MEHLLKLSGKSKASASLSLHLHGSSVTNAPLSGLLSEDDNGATDLGELEKKLTEKSRQTSMVTASSPTSPSQGTSGQEGASSTPQSALTSPEPGRETHRIDDKRKSVVSADEGQEGEEVEALSEMMCSLVTNQCGETRFIGTTP